MSAWTPLRSFFAKLTEHPATPLTIRVDENPEGRWTVSARAYLDRWRRIDDTTPFLTLRGAKRYAAEYLLAVKSNGGIPVWSASWCRIRRAEFRARYGE